jgi:hypothetical protein
MNVEHAPAAMTESHERHSYARLHGRWLLLARAGWSALVTFTLAIFFASLPVYIAQLQTPCAGPACYYTQLSPGQVGALKGMGLSPGDYTAFTVALTLATMIVCLVVSTVIVLRRSDDRMALLVALMLVTIGPIIATSSVPASPSPWRVPNEGLSLLALALLVLVFLLFPSGQFVPRWTRWTLVVFFVTQVPTALVAPIMPNTLIDQLSYFASLGGIAALALIQLYRYRRVSSPIERQQTKWVVFGIAVLATIYVSGSVLNLIFPVLTAPSSLYPPAYLVVQTCLPLFIPLSFGFAMLRYRLWDIDIIINRTLVYGTLTASLALIYLGLVIGLQYLLRGIINQTNDVAIVISTLVIAALFQPLRHGLQKVIDRRFYRRKYDTARTLAAFSAVLRNEVDLDRLREQLVTVVDETIQPAHVSLWLRPSEQAVKYKAIDAYTAIPGGENYEREHLSGDDEPGIGPRLTGREQRVVR